MRHNSAPPHVLLMCEGGEPHWTVRCWARLILCKYYSPDFFSMTWWTSTESTVLGLILPDRRGSCSPSEISWTIWLLFCDQLRLHFSRNKFFGLFPRQRYGPIQTHKAQVQELDYAAHSSMKLSNHAQSKATQIVLAHQLLRYYQPQLVLTTA